MGKRFIKVKRLPVKQRQNKTVAANKVRNDIALASTSWQHKMTQLQRNLWEEAAARVNENKALFVNIGVNQASNVVRKPTGPFTGFTLFVATQSLASQHNIPVPRFDAPVTLPFPNPPVLTGLTISNFVVTVSWVDPDMTGWPPGSIGKLSLWVKVQSRFLMYPHIVAIINLPSIGSFSFDKIRVKGRVFTIDNVRTGQMFVQMKTVLARDIDNDRIAPLWSVPSNILSVEIPLNP